MERTAALTRIKLRSGGPLLLAVATGSAATLPGDGQAAGVGPGRAGRAERATRTHAVAAMNTSAVST